MNDLQLATTLVAPTGTGLLYVAYEQGPDRAVWVNGSGATRSSVFLKRTQPKPSNSDFPGVEQMELRRVQFITVNSIEYQMSVSMITRIPVIVGLSDRTAFHLNAALLARDPVFKTALESGVIPT